MLKIARSTTLDLDATFCLLLNVLDIRSTLSDHLRAKIEPGDGLDGNRNLFLWPFALLKLVADRNILNV